MIKNTFLDSCLRRNDENKIPPLEGGQCKIQIPLAPFVKGDKKPQPLGGFLF
ncbi:MAG: hypothetical protein Q7R92_04775 [bacterium]|nr:hypothetical protein [bacterium]